MVTLGADWQMSSWEASDIAEMSPYHRKKRVLDVVLASVALIALLPVFVLVAIVVRLDSRGPAFYKQERVGLDRRRGAGVTPIRGNRRKKQSYGRPFTIYKFRTMDCDAEERYAEVASLSETRGAAFKMSDDPRVTPTGRFVRKWTLDELPQLINVLKGEMSLVGPRPLSELDDQGVVGWNRHRLDLVPGLTGPWQVMGRTSIPFQEMIDLAEFDFIASNLDNLEENLTGVETLTEIRELGWAAEVQEMIMDEAGVAAPIRGHGGLVVGAIGVSGTVERICDAQGVPQPALVTQVRHAARAISRDLGAARW